MKRRWLRIFWKVALLALVVLGLGSVGQSYWEKREARLREANERWLESVVIDRVEWDNVPLAECLAWVNQRIEATPGRPRGLHVALASPGDTARRFRRQVLPVPTPPEIPGLPPSPVEPPDGSLDKIELTLRHQSLGNVLKNLSSLRGLAEEIGPHRILFHAVNGVEGTFEPLVSKTFRWVPEVFQSGRWPYGTPGRDMRPFLAAQNLKFYEGCLADFDFQRGELHLITTPTNIEMVDYIFSEGRRFSWWERTQQRVDFWLYLLREWLSPSPPLLPMPQQAPGSPVPGLPQ